MLPLKRREFISLLGGAAAAWPIAARAQRGATPVIGYLSLRSPDAERPLLVPFLQSLEKSGFADGRNIAIEYRFAHGREARLPNFAAELLNRQVSLLVAFSRQAASSEGCHLNNSHRLRYWVRSSLRWPCDEPQPTWRQRHRHQRVFN